MKDESQPQIIAVVFGGDGYIGQNLIAKLLKISLHDKIYVFDLKKSNAKDFSYDDPKVAFIKGDVRDKILLNVGKINTVKSWIFNFAAIHREPGHNFQEYFDTNIPGAIHISDFARETGIQNIFFTSSIAPYGKAIEERTESSPLYPETGYGISKALAEKIHENWLAENKDRRLIIVRPSVIFGPRDPGNVYRMIRALRKGTFILPNGGNVIKAYGYIFGLLDSMFFTMAKNERLIVYNYAENPLIPLNQMVKVIKESMGYSRPTISISTRILATMASFIQFGMKLIGKKSDIHPIRVRKAGFPTNIKPQYLIDNGFNFKYRFENALSDWKEHSPEDFE